METLSTADLSVGPGHCSSPILIVAHPGHELRVHGWLEAARPLVCVLTDGSGSGGEGRIESTSALLNRTVSRRGSVYGRMTDREVYAAILDGQSHVFRELANELAEMLERTDADCVVGDAVEGYNPSHDVCRLAINAAIRIATKRSGRRIANFDFLLVGAPSGCPESIRDEAYWLHLDDDALARKLAAADRYPELSGEVTAALEKWGTAPFRTECIRPVDAYDRYVWPVDEKPFYESYGEKRVAEGVYSRVLRFRDHVMPIADALWSHSGQSS
jgi:hypothetical protein